MQCYALPSMVRAKHISEDLLNTAEAARFLRVSQASVRRWSDSGLLAAKRVGRRRERRFSGRDPQAFIARPSPGVAPPRPPTRNLRGRGGGGPGPPPSAFTAEP